MTSRQYKKLWIKARITWICDRYGTVERGYLADYLLRDCQYALSGPTATLEPPGSVHLPGDGRVLCLPQVVITCVHAKARPKLSKK